MNPAAYYLTSERAPQGPMTWKGFTSRKRWDKTVKRGIISGKVTSLGAGKRRDKQTDDLTSADWDIPD